MMKPNEFEINPFLEEIDSIPIQPGYGHVDANMERAWEAAQELVICRDLTYNADIRARDLVVVPRDPRLCVEFASINFDKYYANAINQDLFRYIEDRSINVWEQQPYEVVGVDKDPQDLITEISAFDDSKYYYNRLSDAPVLMKYNKKTRHWTKIAPMTVITEDPYTEYVYDIKDIKAENLYYNITADEIFLFHYQLYWVRIKYTGLLLLTETEFYNEMYHCYLDINDTFRVDMDEVKIVWKHPEGEVKTPVKGTVYYDAFASKYYLYDGNIYIEIQQNAALKPFKHMY